MVRRLAERASCGVTLEDRVRVLYVWNVEHRRRKLGKNVDEVGRRTCLVMMLVDYVPNDDRRRLLLLLLLLLLLRRER